MPLQLHALEDELEEARADNVELSRVWPHLDSVTQQLEETRTGAKVGCIAQPNTEVGE